MSLVDLAGDFDMADGSEYSYPELPTEVLCRLNPKPNLIQVWG